MTHFVTVVVVPTGAEDEQKYLEQVLDRYDENRRVPEYVNDEDAEGEAGRAREFFRSTLREWRERQANGTARPWDTQQPYDCEGKSDIEVLQAYNDRWRLDPDGKLREYSTYNPESKWDWWVIGGRWAGEFSPTDHLSVADAIDEIQSSNPSEWKFPYSLVTAEGDWVTKGDMGWFGIAKPGMTDTEWHQKVLDELRKQPEGTLVFLDLHI